MYNWHSGPNALATDEAKERERGKKRAKQLASSSWTYKETKPKCVRYTSFSHLLYEVYLSYCEDLILVVLVGFQIIVPHVFVLSCHFIYIHSLVAHCMDGNFFMFCDHTSTASMRRAANELSCALQYLLAHGARCLRGTLVIQTEKLL